MSTSSARTVKRCASSLARSSTSLTRRPSRRCVRDRSSSDSSSASGSVTTPSRSAATWPRIAVSGVRSSCETDMRKFRSSSSPPRAARAISRNRSARWPISPPPRHLGHRHVVVALRDLVRRRGEREHRPRDPPREVQREPADDDEADEERDREPESSVSQVVTQLGLRLRDDQLPERGRRRRAGSDSPRRGTSCPRRAASNSNVTILSALARRRPRRARARVRPAVLARERRRRRRRRDGRRSRASSLRGSERGRGLLLVHRAHRRLGVQLREPARLAAQLVQRLVVRV